MGIHPNIAPLKARESLEHDRVESPISTSIRTSCFWLETLLPSFHHLTYSKEKIAYANDRFGALRPRTVDFIRVL